MRYRTVLLLASPILLAGCTTNVSLPVAQPNLQSINLGQPNCTMYCHTTQTATQGEGSVGGAVTQSHSENVSKSLGSGQ